MPDLDLMCDLARDVCTNWDVGYCQEHRQDIRRGGETDCSWLVIWCAQQAGYDTGAAWSTHNLRSELTAHGWRACEPDGNPRRGDLLLHDGKHVAAYLGDGRLCEAWINELGTDVDGQPGDQTGQETRERDYYDYPWLCYLRPPARTTTASQEGLFNMDATHILFAYQNRMYLYCAASHTYQWIPDPGTLTDVTYILTRTGWRVKDWNEINGAGITVGNIRAFGKEVA